MNKKLIITAFCTLSMSIFAETSAELEKMFDAAVKAGEPLKADQCFRELVVKKPNTANIRYYQAAEVSRELGKFNDRKARLAHFLKVEKQWSETTEQAAWEMCRMGADADQYVLICQKVGATPTLFATGNALLERYRREKRAADFKKVTFAML